MNEWKMTGHINQIEIYKVFISLIVRTRYSVFATILHVATA